jgi:hypothetical protein
VSLRALDDRVLPGAAARARRWADRLLLLAERVGRLRSAADLEQLDARWARGPLRGMQRHPTWSLLVVAALLAAGIGVAVDQERTSTPLPQGPGTTDAGPTYDGDRVATLGPAVGANVAAYVQTATAGLVQGARLAPTGPRVALVSLTSYLTPEVAQTLLNGYPVMRAFVRAPAAGREATAFPVEVTGDLLKALRMAYADTARSRAAAATSYQHYVDSLTGTSQENKTFRTLYEQFARASAVEAAQYAGNCACVYAGVVVATPSQLLLLRQRPGIRAVELAGPGLALAQLQVQPLLPDVTGTVPRPTVSGPS